MEQILQYILDLVRTNGLQAMIVGGLVEQIIVPIPSPIITMAGGAILIPSGLSLHQTLWHIFTRVSLPYSISATIGTSMVFLIAYHGGKPLVERYGKKIGISWRLIEKIRQDFQKTIADELFVLITSSIPIVPISLMSAFSGGFRIPPSKFYPMIFLSLVIRSMILGFIGHSMGEAFISMAHGLDKVESYLTVIGSMVILGVLYFKREKWLKANDQ